MDRDPADLSEDERKARGVNTLPASLEEALAAFRKDARVKGWFTTTMVKAYTALKRHEARIYAGSSTEHMCERYMQVY